jgi:hypothetical protein
MRAAVCLVLCGCSGADCTALALRYAAAFEAAQHCVPGQDSCTAAAFVPWEDLPDGGRELSISNCVNTCGPGNVNPLKTGPLIAALNAYRSQGCQQVMGCVCPAVVTPPYTCRATSDGGVCAP